MMFFIVGIKERSMVRDASNGHMPGWLEVKFAHWWTYGIRFGVK